MEGAVAAIWASVNGWFTPALLFVLLNAVIGIIAVTSKGGGGGGGGGGASLDHQPRAEHYQNLARAPSLVLQRLLSLNLRRRDPSDSSSISAASISPPDPSPISAVAAISSPDPSPISSLAGFRDSDPDPDHAFGRSLSEGHQISAAGKTPERINKSASSNSAFTNIAAEAELPPEEEDGGEVDARADDFINKFRQQLKLQRLESLARYREMLHRGK